MGRKYAGMYSFPKLDKDRKYIVLWALPFKEPTNVVCSHSLGILGMNLANVHHPSQYLIKLPSNVIQKFW